MVCRDPITLSFRKVPVIQEGMRVLTHFGSIPAPHAAAALLLTCFLAGTARSAPLPNSGAGSGTDSVRQDDPRIDPESGRQLARWAPDRPFDHQHMRLEVDVPDLNSPHLTGVLTLRASAIGSPRSTLALNCRGPEVDEVTIGDEVCTFSIENEKLLISLPHEVAPGQSVEVVIRYSLDFGANKGEGLTFSKGRPENDSPTIKAPQIHAQGQAELNSLWFPCHDSPNERLTSEVIITIPDSEDEYPFEVVSNGHLVSKESLEGKRTRWHWSQDKPHAPYLVTLAVGKFAVLELGGPDSARPGLPMPLYTTRGTEENARKVFEDTARMVAFFETTFGEKYPWDMYAQVIVRDFAAGGMENTSATLLTISTARARPGTQDDLISHELAHQWTGDLLTCRTWDHLWLNEGWATYAEALWNEYEASHPVAAAAKDDANSEPIDLKEAGHKAYIRTIVQNARGLRARNRAAAPEYPSLVSNRYVDPDSVFMKTDNPYSKGAVVLHMLRMKLGDDAFFTGVRDYIRTYKNKTVETSDFRRALEKASGQSLVAFFDQWTTRPGLPRLAVDYAWKDSGQLEVGIEQIQTIDRLNPAYVFTLPMVVTYSDGTKQSIAIDVDSRRSAASFPLSSRPERIQIDPDLTVLAATTIRTALPDEPDPVPASTGGTPVKETPPHP